MKKWKIKVPDGVALEVERAAASHGVPLNQFVVQLLVAAVSDPERVPDPDTVQRVHEDIEAVLREIER